MCHLQHVSYLTSLCHSFSRHFQVPYHHYLVDQFRVSFDIYLAILHGIDMQVQSCLGRDTENWRALNICPPCLYKLEDDPPLIFSTQFMMDGNSSLKQVDSTLKLHQERPDDHEFRSDIWLTPKEVDVFKDEVLNAKQRVRLKSVNISL